MFSATHMEKTDQGYRLPEKIRRDSYANYLLEGERKSIFTNVCSKMNFFLNFYVSILLELDLSLAQFSSPAYIKLQSIYLDLGIKLSGWSFP